MRKLTYLLIVIFSILFIEAKEYNSILTFKYWDLQEVYSDSLCIDTYNDPSAAQGLYFNGLCVTEYYMNNGVRESPHEYSENCYTMLSHDIFRSDEYEILGDTIRFWGKSYSLLKLNKDTLILKSAQAPYRFYCYTLSKDQQSAIKNIKTKELKSIAGFIKTAHIFFKGEDGLKNTFTLYDHGLQKEKKIKVNFMLYFYEGRLEIDDYKIVNIKYYEEALNEWKELDEVSVNVYSEEIANCLHHFSVELKDENRPIPWDEVGKQCVLPATFVVSP